MTDPTLILLQNEAKRNWQEIVTFCKQRNDGPSALVHEDFLETLIASAYHAGEKRTIEELEAISEMLDEDAWSRIKYQYDARNAQ